MHLAEYSMSQLITLAQVFFNCKSLINSIGIEEMLMERVQSMHEDDLVTLLNLYKED